MKLIKILPNIHQRYHSIDIEGISEDSRLAKEKDAFFIIERENFDIFSVLKELDGKVSVFIADVKNKQKVLSTVTKSPVVFLQNVKEHFHKAVDRFYDFKSEDFYFIGVTGTNGKTTVTNLIYHLLKNFGKKVALLGTVNYILDDEKIDSIYTTPDYLLLRKILHRAKQKSIEYVVMEVSSHSLVQERVKGINFSRCIFTNLSRDHLDYHKTMKNYFEAKKKLFIENPQATAIINIDDPYGRKIEKEVKHKFSYSIKRDATFMAKNIKFFKDKTYFDFAYKDSFIKVESPLLGEYNVANALAALVTIFSYGFNLQEAISLLTSFKTVDGRLQKVAEDIFVDYAHTPDALKRVILTLRQIGYKKVICVFGCGGNRDKGKREIMGEIASQLASFTFITSDNPRDEDPISICNQIRKGFGNKKNFSIIVDRKQAIKEAISLYKRLIKNNDCCILVAGKGHEEYQIIKDKKIPFKDSEVILSILKNET